MLKLPLWTTLAILGALLACTGTTATPDPTLTPAPVGIAATFTLPANTPTQSADPTSTEAPAPTVPPRKPPTTMPTPASQLTPEPTGIPLPDGRIAPIRLRDLLAQASNLSEVELACIGDLPEALARVLEWPSQESKDETLRLMGCLSDETLARLFLVGLITGPDPVSLETSECVRAAFTVIDPREVMTAGLEEDPERASRAMAASAAVATTVTSCFTDEEWERTTPGIEIGPHERAEKRCLLETLGGPGEMAEVMRAAAEGDFTGLDEAAATCGLDRGPETGQQPAVPPPSQTPDH